MAFAKQCQFMYLASLFLLGVWATQASSRLLNQQSMLERHEEWMDRHGRVYKDAVEKERRFKIFKDNVERIEASNAGLDRGYKLSVNQFADLTNEEFRASHTGYKRKSLQVMSPTSKPTPFRYANLSDVPSTIDWRTKGAVTPVKSQGKCGCCWAFSAVAAMEGITQLKTGKLISLSEQELVDCDVGGNNNGCSGGIMEAAFEFIKQNNGLATEDKYPYMGDQSTCNTEKAALAAATITGYEDVPSNSEMAILQAVANQPVSVAIEGSGNDFRFYSNGVFTGTCGTNLNHAVTAVGYGTDTDGTKYWLLKNSWGAGWGESGYMRLQRDVAAKEGLCGIAMDSSYPTA